MRIKLTEEIKQQAWKYVNENDLGKRHSANGNKAEQYVGILGELAVKQIFKGNTNIDDGFDGGFDFEHKDLKIDVKTMGRQVDPRPEFVNNFIAYQKDLKAEAFIFCSLNKRSSELFLVGWITKDDLLEKAEKYKKGTERTRSDGTTFKLKAPTYEIKNEDLNSINSLL